MQVEVPRGQREPSSPGHDGSDEQMVGAKQQIPAPGQCHKEAEPANAALSLRKEIKTWLRLLRVNLLLYQLLPRTTPWVMMVTLLLPFRTCWRMMPVVQKP